MTDFVELAKVLDSIADTTKRTLKIRIAGEFLRGVDPDEIGQTALFLSGRIFAERDQRVLNLSWRGLLNAIGSLMDLKDDSVSSVYEGDVGEAIATLVEEYGKTRQTTLFSEPLTIGSVWKTALKIADTKGKGSVKEREALIASLFVEASPREARYLAALFLADMRTGLSEGLLVESIAFAYEISPTIVRRAWSFIGDLGEVARLAYDGEALDKINVKVMRAVKPMLASPSDDVGSLLDSTTGFSFEMKLDGARVQIHKEEDRVKIFSRRLIDVTESLPDIVEIVQNTISARRIILDGEVLAVDESGKPYPFQVVMTRFGRTRDIDVAHQDTRLKLVLFDILLLDDDHLVDSPYSERRLSLENSVSSEFVIERLVSDDVEEVNDYFRKSRESGHEGLVAKSMQSPYEPGVRGKHWFKIKHTLETMDLMIIAAEWGHGRRNKWLSDYHLAVRDEATDQFVMIGKTYKGLTDAEFEQITQDLKKLEISQRRGVVQVRPEIVVEVLAAEIQESPTYSSGYALRFARIINIREDKGPEDVMTLEELEKVFNDQFRYKAR
ncbi:MAG: ATP-dependent DNA ligase [Candidatus Thorarchaeota archaeon]